MNLSMRYIQGDGFFKSYEQHAKKHNSFVAAESLKDHMAEVRVHDYSEGISMDAGQAFVNRARELVRSLSEHTYEFLQEIIAAEVESSLNSFIGLANTEDNRQRLSQAIMSSLRSYPDFPAAMFGDIGVVINPDPVRSDVQIDIQLSNGSSIRAEPIHGDSTIRGRGRQAAYGPDL